MKVNVAIIGLGYWGPNILRNFLSHDDIEVKVLCDRDNNALGKVKNIRSNIKVTTNENKIFSSSEVDLVAIITPVSTHFKLAKAALESGKHVFIEKPMASSAAECEELIAIAEKKNLQIFVDHTFLFTGAVRKIKEIINDNILGDLFYYDSTRVNLGLFQHDIDVVWDLAPHDFSIIDYLCEKKALAVSASGFDHFDRNLANIAHVTVYFEDNFVGYFNFNWLSPVKIRKTLIGGSKKMLVWDDLSQDQKIKIYDKGVEVKNKEGAYKMMMDYRTGDMYAPKVELTEALGLETEYIYNCLVNKKRALNDGHAGLRIVKMLEACQISMDNKSKQVDL